MSRRGYNFEDAILVSEQLVKTTAHQHSCREARVRGRQTKPAERHAEITGRTKSIERNLDSAVSCAGAEVKSGDVLPARSRRRAKAPTGEENDPRRFRRQGRVQEYAAWCRTARTA
jgi:DNA-directed RNA polymerase beta subunit